MANTIQDKLAYLEETKGLIKEAIVAKGVDVTDTDTFRSYADKIEAIQTGGSLAGAPSGIRFSNSTFTTVPTELIPYLEAQTDLSVMFQYCKNLTTVPLFDTSRATITTRMFESCGSLVTVPAFNTSRATNLDFMFLYCTSLQTVPAFNTSSATNLYSIFGSCEKLKTVPQFDTSSATNMDNMFRGCTSLQTVPLLNVSRATDVFSIFSECESLANLDGLIGLKSNLDLRYSYDLTVESVMNVINNAADMTSSPKTLVLKQYVFNKLTEDQIATASAKGWNIAAR